MNTLYVVGLANGLYRAVTGCPQVVAVFDRATALKVQAGHHGSYLEPYDAFDIYLTEFSD